MSLNNRVSLLELVNTTSEVAQKVENQLPLFYSIWSPVKMSDSWVKADGTYLSGITYHDQYEYLLKILNKQIVGTGYTSNNVGAFSNLGKGSISADGYISYPW